MISADGVTKQTRGPLRGLLVADFSRVLAGPLATMMLADLGANVVKVERPITGDDTRSWGPPFTTAGESSYFLAANRNKRSIELDLREPGDRQAAHRLATRADVVVENFRAGVMMNFGLDYTTLAQENAGLVYCRISGFGDTGGRGLPGYDFLAQAMSGLMSITGDDSAGPMKTGVAVLDVVVGLHATIGILAALQERDRTGLGQRVDVNLMSSGLATLVNQASSYLTAGVNPVRLGNEHPNIVPYGSFRTGTTPIVIAVGTDRQFRALCEALGVPEAANDRRWRTNPDRVEDRETLIPYLEEILQQRPCESWIPILRSACVPCGPILDVREAFDFSAQIGLDAVIAVPSVDGTPIKTVANPIGLSRTPAGYRMGPPRLGEHTEQVLAWLFDRTAHEPREARTGPTRTAK